MARPTRPSPAMVTSAPAGGSDLGSGPIFGVGTRRQRGQEGTMGAVSAARGASSLARSWQRGLHPQALPVRREGPPSADYRLQPGRDLRTAEFP